MKQISEELVSNIKVLLGNVKVPYGDASFLRTIIYELSNLEDVVENVVEKTPVKTGRKTEVIKDEQKS